MNTNEKGYGDGFQAKEEEPPPFMKTWNRIYAAIALYTCALILALYLITVALNRQ